LLTQGDHKKDNILLPLAVHNTPTSQQAKGRLRATTRGWQLYARWNDHSIPYVSLGDLKKSDPVDIPERVHSHYEVHLRDCICLVGSIHYQKESSHYHVSQEAIFPFPKVPSSLGQSYLRLS
jgi:hypothetical protein